MPSQSSHIHIHQHKSYSIIMSFCGIYVAFMIFAIIFFFSSETYTRTHTRCFVIIVTYARACIFTLAIREHSKILRMRVSTIFILETMQQRSEYFVRAPIEIYNILKRQSRILHHYHCRRRRCYVYILNEYRAIQSVFIYMYNGIT